MKTDRHYLEILKKISTEAIIAPTPVERLSLIVQIVATELFWDACSIYIYESEKKSLVLAATYGLSPDSVGNVRLPLSEGLVGASVSQDSPIFLTHASADSRFKYFPVTGEERYVSMAAVPFSSHGKILGVFTVQTIEPYQFTAMDQYFLEILVNQIGQSVIAALSRQTFSNNKEQIIIGIPAAPGIAEARVHILSSSEDSAQIMAREFKGIEFEQKMFSMAIEKALKEIDEITEQLGDSMSPAFQIFFAQKMILKDFEFIKKIDNRIQENSDSAPRAVTMVIDEYIDRFSSFNNKLLREKSQDLTDLKNTLLSHMGELASKRDTNAIEEKMIIVAKELTPQETVRLDLTKVVAFVTEVGTEFSHAAILAKSLQLPAVVGVEGVLNKIKPGDHVIVDGNSGVVQINPKSKMQYLVKNEADWKRYEALRNALNQKEGVGEKGLCKDVSLYANIGLDFEIEHAKRENLNSVGLLRTEFFYMQQQKWPGLKAQTAYYERHLQAFSSGGITIRLLDIGGDKFLGYMPELTGDNSEFGLRSVRLLLDHTEILRSQLKAIHHASKKTGFLPKILIPMVTHPWEITAVKDIMLEETGGVYYPLGVMIETPISMFQVKELAVDADFLSIGTNDLTQYLMAVDRNNPRVSHLHHPLNPALLRAMNYLFGALKDLSKPFSICGEMAGDPISFLALLIIGYRSFSISPTHAPYIQYMVRQIQESTLNEYHSKILKSTSPKDSEKLLRGLISQYAPLLEL